MRPLPRKQNPTSFARRWPRERRQNRGPSEIIKVFNFSSADMDEATVPEWVSRYTPKGYHAEITKATRPAFSHHLEVHVTFHKTK